jgi:hypothetical protein
MSWLPSRRRRSALIVLCLAALAGLFGGAAISVGWAHQGSPRPAIRFFELKPATVRGVNFKPSERVTIVGDYNGLERTKRTEADRRGIFIIRLGGTVKLTGCHAGVEIRARGSRGSAATLKIPPRECAPV